ncbi:GAF domain-containing protein [Flammeovirga kamogawensis]|uniref:GAF domain-containing protein n=1 Tax=Flammeovirga kamogawensis TaxID=373891 RepID=A0ABX8GSG4_9BACT|nr:GAF domain-containing protein [Flammeovirga kamogawensis]MBB6462995.1 methyl-accepting chemotaxis protein [Flammeovirga kamogawensis]QWG06520.1 GAF domain-containing protein [Flammeovirga kamogawensis]TRX68348.1 HAMP domain-containing protein [Flammeovirga kamogawensis]
MIEKYLKQFTIKQIIFWIGGVVIGTISLTVLTLVGLYTNESLEVDISARNAMLSQRIVLLSNIYVDSGDNQTKQELKKAINLFDGSLLAMKHGGTVPEMDGKKIRPASIRVEDYIERVEEVWKPYRSNSRVILEEPLTTSNYTFNMNITLDTTALDSVGLLTKVLEKNVKVGNSLAYLEQNSGTMLKVNQDLVQAYVSDSEEIEFQLTRFILIAVFVILIIVILNALLLRKAIITPLKDLAEKSNEIASGNLNIKFNDYGTSEMHSMRKSLKSMREKLQDISIFVMEFSKGNYNIEFEKINDDQYKEDPFIHSLIDTKNRLEQSSKERSEREWVNEGSARLNKLIRIHSSDAQELGKALVKELARFMNCAHCAFYIVKKDTVTNESYMELSALYAFDSHKEFQSQKIKIGEGLIGEIWQEGLPIYLTEIPEDYIKIRSGLGDAAPNSLSIYPFKSHGEVEVILEIASFHPLEEKSLQLLDEIGGAIATSVATSENTSNVSKLYNDSKRLTDELRTSEEEMKQNMEELQATQEQLVRERRETESNKKLLNEVVDITGGRIIIVESEGQIWFSSQSFLDIVQYSLDELLHFDIGTLFPDYSENKTWQVEKLSTVIKLKDSNGELKDVQLEIKQLFLDGSDRWLFTLS